MGSKSLRVETSHKAIPFPAYVCVPAMDAAHGTADLVGDFIRLCGPFLKNGERFAPEDLAHGNFAMG